MIRTDNNPTTEWRLVCSKTTGKHRLHAYPRRLEDIELTRDILSKAHWTVDCRPYLLERRTVMPWEAV